MRVINVKEKGKQLIKISVNKVKCQLDAVT